MLCPACGEDYKDSYEKVGGPKRKVFGPLDHYMLPYMVKGYYCPNCGRVMEFTTSSTGNLFHKRKEIKDEKLLYTLHDYWSFLEKIDKLDEFREFAKTKRKITKHDNQQELFEEENV